MHQDQVLTNYVMIRNAFKSQMESLLGVEHSVIPFNSTKLYPSNPNLKFLQDHFTVTEIEVVVKHLARNKASGPDGLPNEFLQCQWPIIKEWVINIVQGFYNHTVDLTSINKANIIMIPKIDLPEKVGDYRPISVMNVVPKLTGLAASHGLPHHNALQSSAQDRCLWRGSSNQEYSANSFYKVVISGGKSCWRFYFTWQLKLPPSVKVFVFLFLEGKLLTHDVLDTRGFHCELRCEICQACSLETALHIFFQCSYAMGFWRSLSMMVGYEIVHRGSSVQDVVHRSSQSCKRYVSGQTWGVLFFAACWILWRERNNKIFEGCIVDSRRAADRAFREALLWLKNC